MLGKITVAKIYGVTVIADPTCQIGSWRFESADAAGLSKTIRDLEEFLRCRGLKLISLKVEDD